MRIRRSSIVFMFVMIIAVLAIAFERDIYQYVEGHRTFRLTEISFRTMTGDEYFIQDGYAGYIIFYSDMVNCSACLRKLSDLNQIGDIYQQVGYFAVLRSAKTDKSFFGLMAEYGFPGEYLQDPHLRLGNRLNLGDHPHLLFFDRKGCLIACLPLDVDHENLVRQYHRYINEM